jgi:hypothetical protein
MFNSQNGAQTWETILKENLNVTNEEKLNWVSQYAAIHEIHESQIGVNASNFLPTEAHPGVGPVYTTPLNTLGIGNVTAPSQLDPMSTAPYNAANPTGSFWGQVPGSGDIPVSTLPMALNIALLTIGLELVPVIPSKGPWHLLTYMDFPYAGGKLGRVNETSFDGKGELAENKPIYIKIKGLTLDQIKGIREKMEAGDVKVDDVVKVGGFEGTFIALGRMDACPLVKVVKCTDENTSIREEFAEATKVEIGSHTITLEAADADAGTAAQTVEADFVQTSVDLVDGFANFFDGSKNSMTRAQNETGTGNVIGLRLFSKWIQMGAYEVTGTVTRQQLQDLPLYGVDAVGKIMEQLQNEITQHINQRILERVFALGVTNALQQKARQGVDLNLWMGKTGDVDFQVAYPGVPHFTDIYGRDHKTTWGNVKNSEVNTSAENLATRQRRIMSKLLAAANLIQLVGRRGRPTWVVTNGQVATALQDVSGYVVAPMLNTMSQNNTQNLYHAGTVAGLQIYVDPYMDWNDCRICVGRKGDGNSPGVIFMPYILADTVSITAEGTMAPKMLVNSRYAIAEAGFYPELQYLTFCVGSEFGII